MKKKLTALLSLVLTAVLTIPVLAGTKLSTVKAADTLGQYAVEVDGKETGVEIPVMVPLGKMAKATGIPTTKSGRKRKAMNALTGGAYGKYQRTRAAINRPLKYAKHTSTLMGCLISLMMLILLPTIFITLIIGLLL